MSLDLLQSKGGGMLRVISFLSHRLRVGVFRACIWVGCALSSSTLLFAQLIGSHLDALGGIHPGNETGIAALVRSTSRSIRSALWQVSTKTIAASFVPLFSLLQ